MPKVSVIMSIYRPDAGYLEEQLRSIDEQDFDDLEVVVYNDCPDDPDWEDFCRERVVRHPLRYVAGEQNLGYVGAFERLVGLAEGDYLVLCDQDDVWLPGRVSRGVELLDAGYLLVFCDYQIIDGEGKVTCPSWRQEHPSDAAVCWHTGEHITARAAFACYALGMATMLRADVARQLRPFPHITGHDKWLALGASALGPCANIEEPLVQYRQHGSNRTGSLRGIEGKADWRRMRTERSYELVEEFARHFPDSPDLPEMRAFAEARLKGDVLGIWRHRGLEPRVARLEIALCLTPDVVFRAALRVLRGRRSRS